MCALLEGYSNHHFTCTRGTFDHPCGYGLHKRSAIEYKTRDTQIDSTVSFAISHLQDIFVHGVICGVRCVVRCQRALVKSSNSEVLSQSTWVTGKQTFCRHATMVIGGDWWCEKKSIVQVCHNFDKIETQFFKKSVILAVIGTPPTCTLTLGFVALNPYTSTRATPPCKHRVIAADAEHDSALFAHDFIPRGSRPVVHRLTPTKHK